MRILQVCVDLDGGGIDRYLYNYCSRIKSIEFDFAVVDNGKIGILEDKLVKTGSAVYRVPRIRDGIKKNYDSLVEIMSNKKYDAVHIHLGYKSLNALRAAKKCGIKTRVVHAHIANEIETYKQKIIRKILSKLVKCQATNLMACGNDAAKYIFGKKTFNKGKVLVQKNAIETKQFLYSKNKRDEIRTKLNIPQESLVFGHVGRLCEQKNQIRLINIFNEICKLKDAYLILIGNGEKEKEIISRIKELNLQDKVMLLGVRNDIPTLLNCFDVFIFPSLYEGLPFTLIETQSNGLYALCSNSVTSQVKITNCIEFLSLENTDQIWAKKAIELSNKERDCSANKEIALRGYDIDVEAKKLEEYYFRIIEENAYNN